MVLLGKYAVIAPQHCSNMGLSTPKMEAMKHCWVGMCKVLRILVSKQCVACGLMAVWITHTGTWTHGFRFGRIRHTSSPHQCSIHALTCMPSTELQLCCLQTHFGQTPVLLHKTFINMQRCVRCVSCCFLFRFLFLLCVPKCTVIAFAWKWRRWSRGQLRGNAGGEATGICFFAGSTFITWACHT